MMMMNPGYVLMVYCFLWILPSSTCFSVLSSQGAQSSCSNTVCCHDPADLVASGFVTSTDTEKSTVTAIQQQPQRQLLRLILVDVENVRGKTNFQQNHETFIARACALAQKGQLQMKEDKGRSSDEECPASNIYEYSYYY
jgi:hypothetical protein